MTRHDDLLARYKHFRQVGFELNNRLVKTLSKSDLDEGGKDLGLLRGNVLVLEAEDQMGLLADYCIHDVRREGVNAVERYFATSPPPPGSDEMAVLQALRRARFTVFVVEAREPGVGVQARDLWRDGTFFLCDVSLSHSGSVGMVLASRVMEVEAVVMTTGAPLPLGELPPAEQGRYLEAMTSVFQREDLENLSPEEASELAATVIRQALERGAGQQVAYTEPKPSWRRGVGSRERSPARAAGRNDLCPCGSGKKFKRCCAARR